MRISALLIFLFLLCLGVSPLLHAQLTITNGENSLQISGIISTYLNFRTLDSGEVEKDKNRFNLRDAQIQLEGRKGKHWEYELQVDFADLGQASADPENPGIMDAYVSYGGFNAFSIKLGYGKLPWSRSSLTPFAYSSYWQRAEFLRGNLASRRDIGLELSKSIWKQRLRIAAGAYTGLGEQSLQGDNDASGAFEYVGRIDLGYPTRLRFREIDERHSRLPILAIGLNARYTERNLPQGEFFPAGSSGDWGIKVINGKRLGLAADASIQFRGWSAQFEINQFKSTPSDTNSVFLQGLSRAQSGGYFRSGGWMTQTSYHVRGLNIVISGRYESYNINDLFKGENERISFALAWMADSYRSMFKFQYIQILQKENIDLPDWQEQFRLGWQYGF